MEEDKAFFFLCYRCKSVDTVILLIDEESLSVEDDDEICVLIHRLAPPELMYLVRY